MQAVLLVIFLSVGACWAAQGPKVTIGQGALIGKTMTSRSGRVFSAFQGIPYAAPPVGDLRFQSPRAPVKWEGERVAQKEGSDCLQGHFIHPIYAGSEDCLFINVYTPITGEKAQLPVMFWVHGGGFMSGSGSTEMYGPEFLLDHNVVLVTANYRLGMLGFLNLGTPEFPGNYGLKDQAAALKWVKENIAAFGGNPNSVTIFGESAGSASAHYLLISPLTKGLFHRAILQSGTAFNPWASVIEAKRIGWDSVRKLGCNDDDFDEVADCLRNLDASKLVDEGAAMKERERRVLEFAPAVEPKGTVDPFLPANPRELEIPDVPIITGLTTHEGLIHPFFLQSSEPNLDKDYSENRDYFILEDLGLKKYSNEWEKTWKKVETYYKSLEETELEQYLQLASDVDFNVGVDQLLRKAVVSKRKSPVFYYEFTHDGSLALAKKYLEFDAPEGTTCHADELGYQFSSELFNWKEAPARDQRMIEIISTLWTNFATTGNPTPDDSFGAIWLPVEKTSSNPDDIITRHLDLGEDLEMINESLNGERMLFWSQIYRESNKIRKEEL
ncbi:esterase FE4-like [Cloeon dipterum]|uniref:esterase FE4-like n=1 Tax=Cloeon dipterum TaxID=197152 RepID=UPI00322057DD